MSKFKNSESWKKGHETEALFSSCLSKRGITHQAASKSEQMLKHIDFHTEKGTIDVKAMKKIQREDSYAQNDLIWLEFANVRGNTGWIRSDVDYIAFERANDFLIVKRQLLLELAESLCDLVNITTQAKEALYKGYQRKGRADLISMIKMSDILTLPHKSIPK